MGSTLRSNQRSSTESDRIGMSATTTSMISASGEQHNDYNNVNFLEDDIMGVEQVENVDTFDSIAADLIMAYGDFPNTLSEENVVVTAEFPALIHKDSFSHMPTPGFDDDMQKYTYSSPPAAQPHPTMIQEEE